MRRAHTSPACPVAWLRHRAGAVRVGAVIGCETRRSLGPEAASEPDRQGHRWRSHSSRSEAAPVSAGSRELPRPPLPPAQLSSGPKGPVLAEGRTHMWKEQSQFALRIQDFHSSNAPSDLAPDKTGAFKEDIQMANRYMERCQYC